MVDSQTSTGCFCYAYEHHRLFFCNNFSLKFLSFCRTVLLPSSVSTTLARASLWLISLLYD